MRSTTSLWLIGAIVASLATQAVAPAGVPCGPGTSNMGGICEYCMPGFYQPQPNPQDPTPCQPAPQGTSACGPFGGPNGPCYGATAASPCQPGFYQPLMAQPSCTRCHRGYRCPGLGQTQQTPCTPGKYMTREGSADGDCDWCPLGTFNNAYGAFSCCNCCAGWYNDLLGQTTCKNCFTTTGRQYGPPRADNPNACQTDPIPGIMQAPSCPSVLFTGPGSATCPPVQGNLQPNPSTMNRRRSHTKICAPGLTACAVFAGKGGFECVNTRTDPENCGGCVDPEDASSPGSGRDCTAIEGVSIVNCVKSKCIVDTCQKGFIRASDGTHCIHATPVLQAANQPDRRSRRHL